MMGQRVSYGFMAIVVMVTLGGIDAAIAVWAHDAPAPWGALLRHGSLLPLLASAVTLAGAVEFNALCRRRDIHPHKRFAYIMIVALMLMPWLSAGGWLGDDVRAQEGLFWQVVSLATAAIGCSVLTVGRRDPRNALRDLGVTLGMIIYLGFLPSFAIQIRCGEVGGQQGVALLAIAVLVTKASDIGAFFTGTLLGRHKLIPEISPAKSVEGAIGGLVSSALVAMFFAGLGSLVTAIGVGGIVILSGSDGVVVTVGGIVDDVTRAYAGTSKPGAMDPMVRALIFGVTLSAIGQIGDLVESCFKRDADVKDSGAILPRFGGILDLIDSPALAMPAAWFLYTVLWDVM